MLTKKTIVIFSNPFGYGPTGKAIAIAENFIKKGFTNLIFAGGQFAQEIIPKSIKYLAVNERDEHEIRNLLKTIENPVVFSSQNRFAIRAARSLGIPSAFLDGLSWFWKDIPSDHFIADEIFWMKYPNIEKRIPVGLKNIHIVPAVIDISDLKEKKNHILIHVGGCKNPLVDAFPKHYLNILARALNTISPCKRKIKITGGAAAINFLKSLLHNNKIEAVSLDHNQFIKELGKSTHLITTAGQTTTLEAFARDIPTSFLLPMNLSQCALTNVLSEFRAAPQKLMWSDYIANNIYPSKLNEKDAIVKFGKYTEEIASSNLLFEKFKFDLVRVVNSIPDNTGQREFIEYVGTNGADIVVEILIKKWNLSK